MKFEKPMEVIIRPTHFMVCMVASIQHYLKARKKRLFDYTTTVKLMFFLRDALDAMMRKVLQMALD